MKGVGQFRRRPPQPLPALLEFFLCLTVGAVFFKKGEVAFDRFGRPALEPPIARHRPDPVADDDKAENADHESQRGADKIDSGEKAHLQLLGMVLRSSSDAARANIWLGGGNRR